MIQVIIPAAGEGKRFKQAGYKTDKPDIWIAGKSMLHHVINNVSPKTQYSLQVIRRDDLMNPTRGAVETVLYADIYNHPLLIANCDQLVKFDVNDFINTDLDGRLVTFHSSSDHHSYVKLDDRGYIAEIAEKKVISDHAVTGIYYFKSGADFKKYAAEVIEEDEKVNGEFYVSSVIAKMIKAGLKLGVYDAPTAILGTPEDLQRFEVAGEMWKSL